MSTAVARSSRPGIRRRHDGAPAGQRQDAAPATRAGASAEGECRKGRLREARASCAPSSFLSASMFFSCSATVACSPRMRPEARSMFARISACCAGVGSTACCATRTAAMSVGLRLFLQEGLRRLGERPFGLRELVLRGFLRARPVVALPSAIDRRVSSGAARRCRDGGHGVSSALSCAIGAGFAAASPPDCRPALRRLVRQQGRARQPRNGAQRLERPARSRLSSAGSCR